MTRPRCHARTLVVPTAASAAPPLEGGADLRERARAATLRLTCVAGSLLPTRETTRRWCSDSRLARYTTSAPSRRARWTVSFTSRRTCSITRIATCTTGSWSK